MSCRDFHLDSVHVVDRRAVMNGELKETVVELVDKLVRRVGLDSIVESDATIIVLTFVAIVLVIAIFSKISGLLGK
jgi:hypothetical protein